MKVYAIKDKEQDRDKELGYFFYYEKSGDYYIELKKDVDEWELPFILDHYARKKMWTIDSYHSRLFISQRVIPPDRQNIGMILKEHGLEEYDEVRLFLLADGRCAQDECYIQKISYDCLPDEIKERRKKYLISASYESDGRFVVGFADGRMAYYDTDQHMEDRTISRMKHYASRLEDAYVNRPGFEVCLPGGHYLTYDEIYDKARDLPVSMNWMERFAADNLMTTQDVMEELGCSRQNVNDLVKRHRLTPVKMNAKLQLFTRRDVMRLL